MRRKLRHRRKARFAVFLVLVSLFLISFLLVWPVLLAWVILPIIRYAPGQIINPGRLLFDIAIASFFLFAFWRGNTLANSLTWMLLLLGFYDIEYVLNFLVFLIVRPEAIATRDWVTTPFYGLGVASCFLAWVRKTKVESAIRIVISVAVLSFLTTLALYISYYGPVVGASRALVATIPGPLIALFGTIWRTRGDWKSREKREFWFRSKHIDSEDWTQPDQEVLYCDVDSFNRDTREATIHVCRFDIGGKCEDRVLQMSDSLGNLVWNEIEDFKGRNAYVSVKGGQIKAISFWGIPRRNDQSLYDVIERLCSQLEISDVETNWLFWQRTKLPVSFWPIYREPPHTVLLDDRLANILSSSEWEPLIASTLILHRSHRRQIILNSAQGLLITASMILLWLPILWLLISPGLLGSTVRAIMLINGIFCFLVYLFVVRLTRHTRLLADRIAGKILGQQNILRALRKIETEVAEYDKQIMGRALHFFLNEPSIGERAKRIANEKPALL